MVVLKWSSWWLARRKEVKILFCSAIHTQDQKPYWGAPEVTVTLLATVAVSLNQKYNNKEEEKILPGWGDYRVISHNVILNLGFYSVQIAPGPHVKLSPPPVNQDLERAPQLLTQTRPFKIRSDLKKMLPFLKHVFRVTTLPLHDRPVWTSNFQMTCLQKHVSTPHWIQIIHSQDNYLSLCQNPFQKKRIFFSVVLLFKGVVQCLTG